MASTLFLSSPLKYITKQTAWTHSLLKKAALSTLQSSSPRHSATNFWADDSISVLKTCIFLCPSHCLPFPSTTNNTYREREREKEYWVEKERSACRLTSHQHRSKSLIFERINKFKGNYCLYASETFKSCLQKCPDGIKLRSRELDKWSGVNNKWTLLCVEKKMKNRKNTKDILRLYKERGIKVAFSTDTSQKAGETTKNQRTFVKGYLLYSVAYHFSLSKPAISSRRIYSETLKTEIFVEWMT